MNKSTERHLNLKWEMKRATLTARQITNQQQKVKASTRDIDGRSDSSHTLPPVAAVTSKTKEKIIFDNLNLI